MKILRHVRLYRLIVNTCTYLVLTICFSSPPSLRSLYFRPAVTLGPAAFLAGAGGAILVAGWADPPGRLLSALPWWGTGTGSGRDGGALWCDMTDRATTIGGPLLPFKSNVMICYDMMYYVMLCYVMLCYVMLCYGMWYYVMLCYVMSCYVML